MSKETLSDLAAKCIRCGFCLESCPTFKLSGNESESPRGRIYLARNADSGQLPWAEASAALDTCMGCRACETACPSGVEYGSILELARHEVEHAKPNLWRSLWIDTMSSRRKLEVALFLARWTGMRKTPALINGLIAREPAEALLPVPQKVMRWPELRDLPPVTSQMSLLEGCAMAVLFPNAHVVTWRLFRRLGVELQPLKAECCGALHAHSGDLETGARRAKVVLDAVPAGHTLVVNSAGCGSHLRPDSKGVVRDVSEVLIDLGVERLLGQAPPASVKIAYHDACHLAHGQGVRAQPRAALAAIPGVELVPLAESDMCCGSAGTYNQFQPKRARLALNRKWANVVASGAEIVALGNPGCHAWLLQAARESNSSIRVLHTIEVLEMALSGLLEAKSPNSA